MLIYHWGIKKIKIVYWLTDWRVFFLFKFNYPINDFQFKHRIITILTKWIQCVQCWWYSRICLIRHHKGPGKRVGLYRMSEYSGFILVNRNTLETINFCRMSENSGVDLHKFHCISFFCGLFTQLWQFVLSVLWSGKKGYTERCTSTRQVAQHVNKGKLNKYILKTSWTQYLIAGNNIGLIFTITIQIIRVTTSSLDNIQKTYT